MEDLSQAGAAAPEQSVAPETAAPAAESAAPDTSAQENSEAALDAELAKVFEKATRETTRDESGRFASKNPAPEQAAEAAKVEPEVKAPEAVAPAVEPPQTLPPELKESFAKLPPEAQKHIGEAHQHINKLYNTVERFRPIGQLLEQHVDSFRSKGLTYAQGIEQMLAADKALRSDPYGAIAQLANTFGVDLARFAGQEGSNPQTSALLDTINTLKSEIESLKQNVGNREAHEEAQRRRSLEDVITKFSADKPDFDELADDISIAVQALRAANPKLSIQDALAQAYEKAQWANPKTRAKRIEAETKAAEQKRQEEAKKAADAAKKANGVNVRGQPQATDTDDLDSKLRSVWNKNAA